MIASSFLALCLAVSSGVQALPLQKRIAQVISDSTAQWEKACLAAGGAQQCNPVSITAFSTLLAAPGPCEQQNAADQMIDLAKKLGNDAEMIRLTQIFVQQPRNSPSSQSVPYCQQAPKNSELNGLFQCQFAGTDKKTFVGGIAAGQAGTIPFGLKALPNPAGSCPAHPDGPVPDGQQLVTLVNSPGKASSGSGSGKNNQNNASSGSASSTANNAASSSSAAAGSSSTGSTSTGAGGFKLQNGKDAQALNAKFSSLTADSACQTGDQVCIGTQFAQCVGGKFVGTQCSGGLGCFALPLVNKAGTSIACTTQSDAEARIAATGATGGITGSGSSAADLTTSGNTSTAPAPAASSSATNNANAAPSGDFKLQNGKDAQALNAKFSSLNANSACNTGDNACVNGGFAQCVGGKFAVTQCAGGTTCAALPLVNKAGTSIACTTQADAEARIAATGATGGLTGSGSSSSANVKSNTSTSAVKNNVAAAAPAAGGFKLQNGKDAQALNRKFASLNANSSCKDGDNACVNGGFAQCVGGKFVVTPCSGGLTCEALPLVNKAGTSIACTTKADAAARIAATGATGGITGA